MVIRCMLIFSFSCKKLNKFKYVFATDRFVPGFGLDKFPFVCVSVMKVRTPCRILSISLDIKLDTCTITRNFYRSMSLIHPAAASRNCSFFPSYDFKTHYILQHSEFERTTRDPKKSNRMEKFRTVHNGIIVLAGYRAFCGF